MVDFQSMHRFQYCKFQVTQAKRQQAPYPLDQVSTYPLRELVNSQFQILFLQKVSQIPSSFESWSLVTDA